MAEQLNMDLRPKRRPNYSKYRASEEQDPDNLTSTRPNYLKMTKTPQNQEYTSPSIQLNQNAKLLVKFIQKANKCKRFSNPAFNDNHLPKDELQRQSNNKESLLTEKIVAEKIGPKKAVQGGKNQKLEAQKKCKELYNFKEIHQNTELIKNLSQQQVLKGVKIFENFSELINSKGIYSGQLPNQLSQLQSLCRNINECNISAINQNPHSNFLESDKKKSEKSTNKNHPIQNQKPVSRHISAKKSRKQVMSDIEKNKQQKVFKRSAYHVAIAYHIYLKELYDQGITSGDLIDPTYRARVVKEQTGLVNQGD